MTWYHGYTRALHVQGLTWAEPVAFGGSGCSLAQPGFAQDGNDLHVAYWCDSESYGFSPAICHVKGSSPLGDAWTEACVINPDFAISSWSINTPLPLAVIAGRLCAVMSADWVKAEYPMIFMSRDLP
jgi:hypothetical protein